jgi:vancomycin aglycone glucosyltransferase
MKIILAPMGSDGDIRPMIALAKSLQQSGHKPFMVIPLNGKEICQKYHLPYHLINIDYREELQRLLIATFRIRIAMRHDEIVAQFSELAKVVEGADLVIGGTAQFAAVHVAEALDIPYYHTPPVTIQVLPSKHYPPPLTIARPLSQKMPGWMNQILWRIYYTLLNRIGRSTINRYRRGLGLKSTRRPQEKLKRYIIAVDKALDTVPADVKTDYVQTDYWHLFEDEKLDPELAAFIESGPPPVYFGLGSMPQKTPKESEKILEEVANSLGIRMIISRGWAGFGQDIANRNIKVVGFSPHHKLFPLMSTVIHHGGGGTVHTTAWAGVPQLIIPQFSDQFHWAERIWYLGLGPYPILKNKLTVETLKSAIQEAISNPKIAEHCKEVKSVVQKREEPYKILDRLDISWKTRKTE